MIKSKVLLFVLAVLGLVMVISIWLAGSGVERPARVSSELALVTGKVGGVMALIEKKGDSWNAQQAVSEVAGLKKKDTGAVGVGEQASLWVAFQKAQLQVQEITSFEASLPENEGVRCFATNPGQGITARFLDGEVRVESGVGGAWAGTLRYGNGRQKKVRPVVSGARVEYHHEGGVTEWFYNRSEGLEHGFTLAKPPTGGSADEVRLLVELGGLIAVGAGEEVTFVDPVTEQSVLNYEGLKVWDARGMPLPARLVAQEKRVEILVATAGAVYPVTVDPLIVSVETKRFSGVPGDGKGGAGLGHSVALSGDRLVIGASTDTPPAGTFAGSAYVFVKEAGVWELEAKLTAPLGAAGDYFGTAVAMDGGTIVVGAPGDDTVAGVDAGCAVVFVRSGSQWMAQTVLEAADAAAGDGYGGAISLHGDIVVIGASGDDTEAGANAGSAYVCRRSGEVWVEEARLNPLDPASNDDFGFSVAVRGETIVVGSPRDDGPVDSGSAYVFGRSDGSWAQVAKLKANDAASNDRFGYSVAFDGQTIVAGATLDDTAAGANAGSAYVFVKPAATWAQLVKLQAVDGQAEDRFGYSLAVDGSTLLVGAFRGDSAGGIDSGSAYVFARSGSVWSLQAKLAASDGATEHFFGSAVALEGGTALVGARFGEGTAGAAYVFDRNGAVWDESQKLTAGRAIDGENFGSAIALEGDLAFIGAPSANSAAGMRSGSVFVFEREGVEWLLTRILKGSNTRGSSRFGTAVALEGDTALVGSVWENTAAGNSAGSAYVFTRVGGIWTEQAKLEAADAAAHDYFGVSVALSADTALVGAWGDDTAAGTNAGSAYVFVRQGTVWMPQAKLEDALGSAFDIFGFVVALHGDTAAVASIWDDTAVGSNAGSVHVFVRDGVTWNLQARLEAEDPGLTANFGRALTLHDDTLLVGAPYHTTSAGSAAGSVCVFERSLNQWNQTATLESLLPGAGAQFGASLAMEGDLLVVGAAGGDTQASVAAGSVEVFLQSEGNRSSVGRLEADDGANGDRFGGMVALSRGTVIVGAANDDSFFPNLNADQNDHGSIYVFRLTGLPRGLLVLGQGEKIANGDKTPSVDDGTDFGVVDLLNKEKKVSFAIENTGDTALHLTGTPRVELRGANARDFRVVSVPSEQLNAGTMSTFSLAFDPSFPGLRTAEVWIKSDDPARPWYTFAVSGFGGLSRSLPQRIAFAAPGTVYLGEGSVGLMAEASSGLPVALEVVSGPGTLAGSVLTPTGPGRITVRATQVGAGNYVAAKAVTRVITVKADPSGLTLTGLSQRYDGMPKPVGTLGAVGAAVVTYQVGRVFGAMAPTAAGRYAVRAVADGVTRTGTLVIAKAPLHVVPEDKRRFVGQANPALTVGFEGFVGEDDETVLTKRPVLATRAKVTSPGGVYPITAKGGVAANYVLVYRQGLLVVESFAARYEALLVDLLGVPSGKVSLIVARSGRSFSGSLVLAGETKALRIRGDLLTSAMVERAGGDATVLRNEISHYMTFELELNGTLSGSLRRNGVLLADLAGRRMLELPKGAKVNYSGAYTAVLGPAQQSPEVAVPAGAGWARARVQSRGAIALVGRLGDGTAFSTSLLPDGDEAPGYRLWVQPYRPARTGTFVGGAFAIQLNPLGSGGFVAEGTELMWAKAERMADKSYPEGFEAVNVSFTLDPWRKPTAIQPLASLLGLSGDAIEVAHSLTGSASDADLPTTLTLSARNTLRVLGGDNPTNWRTTLNTALGTFTGRFELTDAGVRRSVPFSGVLRQPTEDEDEVVGDGHFLMPMLGSESGEVRSGEVLFLR